MHTWMPSRQVLAWSLCSVFAVAVASPACSAIFKVGPGGTHATVQAAIDAALATPEADEIRLRNKIFRENLVLFSTNENLVISGGWNAAFTSAAPAARSTLDARGLGRVLDISQDGGVLTIERLRVKNGQTADSGGGIRAVVRGDGRLEIRNSQLTGNSVTSESGYRQGGGAFVFLSDNSIVSIRGVDFANNGVKSGSAGGGGLSMGHLGGVGGRGTVANCTFRDNFLTVGPAPETGSGSGLLVTSGSQGTAFEILDNVVQRNSQSGEAIAYGVGLAGWLQGSATIEARRNRVLDQTASLPESSTQVTFYADDDAQIRFSDSEVGRSAMYGVGASSYTRAVVRMVNLTVVDNAQVGIGGNSSGSGAVSIANSVVFGNGTYNVSPFANARLVRNLVGVDPQFVNRAAADYRLRDSSQARNRGMANPPGGLGTLDVAGKPRVRGGAVDQGANEIQ